MVAAVISDLSKHHLLQLQKNDSDIETPTKPLFSVSKVWMHYNSRATVKRLQYIREKNGL